MKSRRYIPAFLATLFVCFLSSCGQNQLASDPKGTETPYLGMKMGRGYDYYNQNAVRGDCIISPESKMVESFQEVDDSMESYITQTVVSSHEELMRELEVSNSASIRSLFFAAGPKFKTFDKFKSSEHSLTFLYSLKIATREATLASLSIHDLRPQARDLLESRDFEGFTRLCGTHYVRSISYGGEFSQVFEIDERDQNRIRNFKAALNGKTSAIDGILKGKNGLNSHINSRFVKKEAYQVGGSVHLSNVKLDNYHAKIDEWVKTLQAGKAQAYKVELSDWQTILSKYANPYVKSGREAVLQEIYDMIRRNKANLSRVQYSLFLHEKKRYLNQDSVQAYKQLRKQIEMQQSRLKELGRQCFINAGKCSVAEEPIEPDFLELDKFMPIQTKDFKNHGNIHHLFSVLGFFAILLVPVG